jgi:hypothetical protein
VAVDTRDYESVKSLLKKTIEVCQAANLVTVSMIANIENLDIWTS